MTVKITVTLTHGNILLHFLLVYYITCCCPSAETLSWWAQTSVAPSSVPVSLPSNQLWWMVPLLSKVTPQLGHKIGPLLPPRINFLVSTVSFILAYKCAVIPLIKTNNIPPNSILQDRDEQKTLDFRQLSLNS